MLPSSSFIPGSDLIGTVDEVGSEFFDLEPGTLLHARPQIASRGFFRNKEFYAKYFSGGFPLVN
jgi:hypothetical protein